MVEDYLREPIYIECSCGTEVLRVQYDEELDTYDISMFSLHKDYSWKHKIQQIWHILKTGEPYSDQMVVSRKELAELGMYMADIGFENLKKELDKDK